MRLTRLLSAILLLPTLAVSLAPLSLTITIPSSPQLPSPNALPPSTTCSLTTLSHTYTAHLTTQNNFVFRNVSTGSYLLSILCASHVFAPLRVDVGEDGTVEAWRTFRGNDWENKGEGAMAVGEERTVEAKVLGQKSYYMERQGCKLHFLFIH
jgi:ER membrane protein complex subunit 7